MSNCESGTCRIDAAIMMDAKAQIDLPKDLREKANFKTHEKIAVVACEKEGELCCILKMKTKRLESAVAKRLVPCLKE